MRRNRKRLAHKTPQSSLDSVDLADQAASHVSQNPPPNRNKEISFMCDYGVGSCTDTPHLLVFAFDCKDKYCTSTEYNYKYGVHDPSHP
jgi:hypothetical protein